MTARLLARCSLLPFALALCACSTTGSADDAGRDAAGGAEAGADAGDGGDAASAADAGPDAGDGLPWCTMSAAGCDCVSGSLTDSCRGNTCQCYSDGVPTNAFPTAGYCNAQQFGELCRGTAPAYVATPETIPSGGVARSVLVSARPDADFRTIPIVFALHGDGGSGAGLRAALPLEAYEPAGGAVFVYPDAPGGSFEYWTYDGRTREAQFIMDAIAAITTERSIHAGPVFLVGFSGGATMANALGCRLGPGVVRGLGLHSGTLYSTDGPTGPEFTYTSSGGVTCALPDALFVWGADDTTPGVSFTDGQGVRDNYLATGGCAATTHDGPLAPCVTYDACTHGVAWCPIPGMGHAIWPGAARAMMTFFAALP